MQVFAGIDVACGRKKPLPVCFVTRKNQQLEVVTPPEGFDKRIPRGAGNKEICNESPFEVEARQTAAAFKWLIDEKGWTIERVAIDAPATRPISTSRLSEDALRQHGHSCIRTPNAEIWARQLNLARDHLRAARPLSSLPAANLIWMLYGFTLFRELRKLAIPEIIEVYPYAIVQKICPGCPHKTTPEGYCRQLNAVARATDFEPQALASRLKQNVRGTQHDRLDAFMSAWVASLPEQKRFAYGDGTNLDDAIWIPRG